MIMIIINYFYCYSFDVYWLMVFDIDTIYWGLCLSICLGGSISIGTVALVECWKVVRLKRIMMITICYQILFLFVSLLLLDNNLIGSILFVLFIGTQKKKIMAVKADLIAKYCKYVIVLF